MPVRRVATLLALGCLVGWHTGCRSDVVPTPTVRAGPDVVTFAIAGMHCDGCAMAIGDALNEAEGVLAASVTFADKRAVVRFDSAKTSVAALTLVIEKAGYKPSVVTPAGGTSGSPAP